MCFTNDNYDWIARVCEQSTYTSDLSVRCDECGRDITPDELIFHVYQQEHEDCQCCEDGECECPVTGTDTSGDEERGCCQCANPQYGETCEYDRCQECDKFLQAVEDAEVEAGCALYDARPPLMEMVNAIQDGGADEAKKYIRSAKRRFPELAVSGYLGALWKRMFV